MHTDLPLPHSVSRLSLSALAQGFGVGAAAVGSTISVYAVARLMMNLPAGVLADRYGRKPLLVWGPAVTALGAPHIHPCAAQLALTVGPEHGAGLCSCAQEASPAGCCAPRQAWWAAACRGRSGSCWCGAG